MPKYLKCKQHISDTHGSKKILKGKLESVLTKLEENENIIHQSLPLK